MSPTFPADAPPPEITVPPTSTPIARNVRRVLVVLTVCTIVAGAWALGRFSSPQAASSPAAETSGASTDSGAAWADFETATRDWLDTQEQLLLSIGYGLEVLKAAHEHPNLAADSAVAALNDLLRDGLPTVPASVDALNQHRENADPTGKILPHAWDDFRAANHGRPPTDLAKDTRTLRDARQEAASRSRTITRRAQAVEGLIEASAHQ